MPSVIRVLNESEIPKARAAVQSQRFTFVELLVALFAGIVMVQPFVPMASRQYYAQEQIVQMQESMRFALEYVKNDLRSVGRLSVVNGIELGGRLDRWSRSALLFDSIRRSNCSNAIKTRPSHSFVLAITCGLIDYVYLWTVPKALRINFAGQSPSGAPQSGRPANAKGRESLTRFMYFLIAPSSILCRRQPE